MKKNIQIFRILSCIGVLTVHIGQHIGIDGLRRYTEYGAWGVQVFLMISAIVCFLQFDRKEYILSVKSYIEYIKSRLFRILPLFYFIILLYYIFYKTNGSIPVDSTGLYWWRYILLVFQLIPSENEFWTNIGGVWSISAFLIFYMISPLLYKYLNSLRKSIIGLIGFLILIEISHRFGLYIPKVVLFQEFFLLGIIVYHTIKEHKENLIILVMGCLVLLIGIYKDSLPFVLCYGVGEVIIFSLICAIMMVVTWNYEIRQSATNRIIDIVDKYTYSIYLCHSFVIVVISKLINNSNSILGYILYLVITILGTIIFSMLATLVTDNIMIIMRRICCKTCKAINEK